MRKIDSLPSLLLGGLGGVIDLSRCETMSAAALDGYWGAVMVIVQGGDAEVGAGVVVDANVDHGSDCGGDDGDEGC